MAPHSSTLAWKTPWMEEPGRLQSMGSLRADKTERLHFHFSLSCIGEGNGNPLQCSCLENPRDGGAWWAAVYGVTQSQTRLKRLSSSRDIFGCRNLDNITRIQWVEARDAAKHTTMRRTAPTTKNYLAKMSTVPRSGNFGPYISKGSSPRSPNNFHKSKHVFTATIN